MAKPHNTSFFIVGLGASAGGLEALQEFFKAMPIDSGMAFIVVVHLDPHHVSLLPEILQRHTTIPVNQVTDNLIVEPNKIYLIPPNKRLSILNNHLQIMDLEIPRASHFPIDYFFSSLAQERGDKAICIILSGTGSDGCLGLREIKAAAGLVIAQDEHSAKYTGMPKCAVDTGLVDYVLEPDKMPAKLISYIKYPHVDMPTLSNQANTEAILQKILLLIRNQVGHDFSLYKKNTIYRRIERRMQLHQIEKMPDYLEFLQKNDWEVTALAKELLIGVTSFFRDPEAFEVLKTKYLPDLLAQKANNYTMRVWVPACSTGEEAYSLAIVFQECLDSFNQHINVQIFGTDIDETAVEVARRGFYPLSIRTNVTESRLMRFFIQEEDGFRIKKSIREMLVFATQNITKDAPFTKLDMISCRNLLIYFSAELQAKILPLFHYGLKPSGLLFLGSSETTGQSTEFFTILDRKWKLFSRSQVNSALPKIFTIHEQLNYQINDDLKNPAVIQKAEDLILVQLVEAILRRSAVPPCAVIDANHNIIYVHGRLGRYLEPPQGKISLNIVEMIHPQFKTELISAIRKATQGQSTTQKKPFTLQTDASAINVAISVSPILEHTALSGLLIVSFEEIYGSTPSLPSASKSLSPPMTKTPEEMRQELVWTKENLQTTIEELESANEELKSTNEELQSTNEELQSTNEEMETSKEELQSLNEEAVTVNAELQNRMDEYQTTNDDLKNLFDTTQLATIFLDTQLCIRRFTPKAKQIINLVATDIGRPLAHFSYSLQAINLTEASRQVLKTLDKYEAEIYDNHGRCFFTRILPYRTTNNVIDGTVLSFEDISPRKKIEQALIDSEKRYKNIFDYSPIAIWEEDCSSLEDALLKLKDQGISDLEDYLTKNPDESLKLFKSKRILAANNAALSLFNVVNKDEFWVKLPQILLNTAPDLIRLQLLAIWNQQEKVNLAFNYMDISGTVLALNLTWTITGEQGKLNYGNIITTVLPHNKETL